MEKYYVLLTLNEMDIFFNVLRIDNTYLYSINLFDKINYKVFLVIENNRTTL